MSRTIQMRSNETGVWTVCLDDFSRPLSTHASETAAVLAASEHASQGGSHVSVTDRYGRVHERLPVGPR